MTHPSRAPSRSPSTLWSGLLPLGALAFGLGGPGLALAQAAAPAAEPEAATLPKITVRARAEEAPGKDQLQVTTSTIGKGTQALRDIPQSVTVATEKLIDDRNLDTFKDTLRNTAGITFMAAEGGEEDIRLRGFSLQATGDIFVDGVRDPAFYERDTFNHDRLELLRGSASMLFGRGSTGGAVNQVSKVPMLVDEHELTTTLGSHNHRRMTGDFNLKTGDNAALRLNAMATKADNNGAGSRIDKKGIAGAYRFGADTRDEFTVSLFHLDNHNGINYGMPWIRPNATDSSAANRVITNLDPSAYYGLASDRNDGTASTATLNHIHRFDGGSELRSTVRRGHYTRDQRASAIRVAGVTAPANGTNPLTNPAAVDLSNFGPATVLNRGNNTKVQDLDTVNLQSDFSTRLQAFGLAHRVLSGFDVAREEKTVYRLSAVTKPQTLVGTPNDGLSVDEDGRTQSVASGFVNHALGVYAQDLVQIAPAWKLLGGLRWDRTHGEFDAIDATTGALTTVQQRISELSQRAGVLYQPSETASFHASWGTSFNTSGDTYALNPLSAQTAPEQSQNIEMGARLDSADKRFTARLALFRATKTNERNTDVDTAATAFLLSGKRHSAGFDMDITGRLTPAWEVYGSYMWLPIAQVDQAVPPTASNTSSTFGNRQGDRPGLTPKHSGTVWTTYQLTETLRVGGGLNFRSRQAPADIGTAGGAQSWEVPGFVTADLMAELVVLPQRLTLKVNVSNVSNTLYAESLYRGHYVPGAGRLVQVGANVKF